VFVHGLWLLPSSWDRWAAFFEEDDFVALTPGWPDDPLTVEEANAHPETFAGKSIGDVADHYESVITQLDHTPVIIGHSFGGLIAQILADAVDEDEAKSLYEEFAVPAPGEPLFQAAASNLNPWTEAKVDTENPRRGPLLIMSGEKDHTVPGTLTTAAYKLQSRNEGVTEIVEMPGRGHALTIDHGWREVAETARAFVRRFF
jgi:non-heme chloroperoxidase